ncbi:ABC transporter permease [Paenibacillus tundrae]
MKKLVVKLFRDMKQSIVQCIALVLVIAVGAFFYAGLSSYSQKQREYTEDYFATYHLSDLNVYYDRVAVEDVAQFAKVDGVERIEARYTTDALQYFDGYTAAFTIHSLPSDNQINRPMIIEGRLPSLPAEIMVDSHYAEEHSYQLGDSIRLSTNGREVAFEISGLIENVEYVKKNATQDHKTYAIAYVAQEAIPKIAGSLYYNELLIDTKEGYDVDFIAKTMEAQSVYLSYLGQTSKERSFGYAQIQQTIYNNGMMSKVIPLILFLISAIILFLTMSRTIDSQRNQIGIMKALGIKNSWIMFHYMEYALLVSIIGSLVGCIVALYVFIPLVTASSAKSYSLPGITFALSPWSVLPPLLFSSSFGLLSVYWSGRTILNERAAHAMRPKPPRNMKNLLIERIPGMWKRISFSHKIILRNLFLNKKKAVASSIGTMVSMVLLIIAVGTQASLLKIANQIEDVYTYDLRVDYKIGTALEAIDLPSDIQSHHFISTLPVELVEANNRENATIVVMEKENNLIQLFDQADRPIAMGDHGVIVPKSYADHYNIVEGDFIQLRFTQPERRNQSVTMEVAQITNQYNHPSFYITPTYLESFRVDYHPTSMLIKANNDTELAGIRQFFEQDQRVNSLTDKQEIQESARYILNQNQFMFVMFIISAVILSLGAVYTISSINIHERNRELATLKVLGYPIGKINRLIFKENIILTGLAAVIAVPLGMYCFTIVINALSSTHQQIPDQLNVTGLLISILLAFLLTMLSNLLLRRNIANIHMTESLKSVE